MDTVKIAQNACGAAVHPDQLKWITWYTWRRVGSTLANTCKSSTLEITHFGVWVGVGNNQRAVKEKASTEYRYCGHKGELEQVRKLWQ